MSHPCKSRDASSRIYFSASLRLGILSFRDLNEAWLDKKISFTSRLQRFFFLKVSAEK
jgi:hypothetical protein